MTPEQVGQSTTYTNMERAIRNNMVRGLVTLIKAKEMRDELEARVNEGDLALMSDFYTSQYARLGDPSVVQGLFDNIETAVNTIHQIMWSMHDGLKQTEPGSDLFQNLPPYEAE